MEMEFEERVTLLHGLAIKAIMRHDDSRTHLARVLWNRNLITDKQRAKLEKHKEKED